MFPEFQKIKLFFNKKINVCGLSSFLVYFICIKIITVKLLGLKSSEAPAQVRHLRSLNRQDLGSGREDELYGTLDFCRPWANSPM